MEILLVIAGIITAVVLVIAGLEFRNAYRLHKANKQAEAEFEAERESQQREFSRRMTADAKAARERQHATAVQAKRQDERRTAYGGSSYLKEVSTRRQDDLYTQNEQNAIAAHQAMISSLYSRSNDDSSSRLSSSRCDSDSSSSSSSDSGSSDSSCSSGD